MYMEFSATAAIESIDAALNALQEQRDRRALGVRLPDGRYCLIGEIVKYEDCPQEVFDEALAFMANL